MLRSLEAIEQAAQREELRRRFRGEAAEAEQESEATGETCDAADVFDRLEARAYGESTRRPRYWRISTHASRRDESRPPPPAFASAPYRDEEHEVLPVSRTLTAAQRRIADDGNLDKRSVTPPGVWNRKAMALVAQHGLETAQAARVLAMSPWPMRWSPAGKFAYWMDGAAGQRDPRATR